MKVVIIENKIIIYITSLKEVFQNLGAQVGLKMEWVITFKHIWAPQVSYKMTPVVGI